MNDVEQRLQSAANETRQLANGLRPRRLPEKPSRHTSGWLAFAVAFAVVAVTFGVIPLLMGSAGPNPLTEENVPLTAPVDTATTTPTATTVDRGEVTCSADGAALPPDITGLPDAVARTMAALVEAASSCDLASLETLATDGFNTSFGGGGFDNLAIWEEEGEGKLGLLVEILDLTHATIEAPEGKDIYVWPAAFAYESWDAIPDDLLDELHQVYTQEELDQIAGLGSYGGWRTGIDEDGAWLFFVAGD